MTEGAAALGAYERLRRLQAITDAVLAHVSLDELLDLLLTRVCEVLGVDTSAVLLLDAETNELVPRAAKGLDEKVEVGRGFAGRVAAARAPVVLDEVDPVLREKGIKSLLGVPLLLEDRVLGVMHVGTLVPHAFTPDEIELLQLAADRAAVGIEHARLFEAERAARTRAEGSAERLRRIGLVTEAALQDLALDDVFAVLLGRIRDLLAADTCAILLLDPERGELVARAAVGLEEEVERGVRIPLGRGFAGRVASERRPVVLEDADRAAVFNPLLREKGIRSLLGTPLEFQGRVIGVVHVGTLARRTFAPEDVELLQVAAERAALGIERARVHEELLRLDRLKLDFIAFAAHELRTPVANVRGSAMTLARRGAELGDSQRAKLVDALDRQSGRLAVLVEQLLDLSRLDAGAVPIQPEPLPVRERVEELVAGAGAPPDAVAIDVPTGLAAVADPIAFDRIVSNLVANALRYGAPPVTITAEQRDQHFRLRVADRGPGVSPEFEASLFDRFTRSEPSRRTGGGLGLGLAIARSYAHAHGGDVLYSRGEPTGASFELVLPA